MRRSVASWGCRGGVLEGGGEGGFMGREMGFDVGFQWKC